MPTKILVADDSATMRRVLEMTFAGEDATVHTVDTAEAALAKAGELSPDIIFADASLPNVDGYELAKRIKTTPALAKIAVVVMASQQTPYDESKGRAAGVDDHISKPFDTQSVIDRVGQVLGRARALPAGAEGAARPVPPPPVARPAAAPASMAAAPGTGTSRLPQGTRMGMGAPIPVQTAQAKSAATAPQPIPAARPAPPVAMPAAAAKTAAPTNVTRPAMAAVQVQTLANTATSAATAAAPDLSAKLVNLGLTREQVEGVLALSREVIEQVVWEVVPELAEQLIKEEIRRLTAE